MFTPCVKICTLLDGVCIGCKRTVQQITDWMTYTPEQQLTIMEQLKQKPDAV